MPLDPRTPVIVGAGQMLRKLESAVSASEPVDMMVAAARAAAADSGSGDALLARADSVRTVELLSWRYENAALLLAERLGASPRQTMKAVTGGNSPQALVNDASAAIQRRELDVVVIAGAEAIYSRMLARKGPDRTHLDWTIQPDSTPAPETLGKDAPGSSNYEMTKSLAMPVQVYPLFENALRAARSESIDDHQRRLGDLWARFSAVAATNPHAWSPEPRTAEEIRTVTADNRMVGFPYTKLMNANIQTDQAAALIVCSVAAARAAGVPDDRWVFVHSGAEANDHWYVTERADLVSSPAIAACGRAAFDLAGTGIDGIAHLDLYSCFPSAVQIGAAALGVDLDDADRAPTVTGGLGFAGGPGNNYVTHSIASMVEVLRGDPGSFGLVTALGWYVTKHAVGIYSTEPPAAGFRGENVQAAVDALPRRTVDEDYTGPATVETYTVMHERDGSPSLGIIVALTPAGDRTLATTRETGVLKDMTVDERSGRAVTIAAGGTLATG